MSPEEKTRGDLLQVTHYECLSPPLCSRWALFQDTYLRKYSNTENLALFFLQDALYKISCARGISNCNYNQPTGRSPELAIRTQRSSQVKRALFFQQQWTELNKSKWNHTAKSPSKLKGLLKRYWMITQGNQKSLMSATQPGSSQLLTPESIFFEEGGTWKMK